MALLQELLERKGCGPEAGKHSLTTGGQFGTVCRECPQGAVLSTAQTSKCLLDINILILHHSHPNLPEPRVRWQSPTGKLRKEK